jgi:hypothetical protein
MSRLDKLRDKIRCPSGYFDSPLASYNEQDPAVVQLKGSFFRLREDTLELLSIMDAALEAVVALKDASRLSAPLDLDKAKSSVIPNPPQWVRMQDRAIMQYEHLRRALSEGDLTEITSSSQGAPDVTRSEEPNNDARSGVAAGIFGKSLTLREESNPEQISARDSVVRPSRLRPGNDDAQGNRDDA